MPRPSSSAPITTNALWALPLSFSFARFLTAHIGFIHLHPPVKPISAGTNHRSPEFVQPCPGRLVASQAQDLLKTDGTGTILLAGHVPDRSKPHPQWLVGVLKDSSRRYRGLVSTGTTNDPPSRCGPTAVALATWANKSIRPPQLQQILSAGILRAKPVLQFQNSPRIIFHTPIHYILG